MGIVRSVFWGSAAWFSATALMVHPEMALGLAIAIPCYIAFNYLVGRKNDLAVDIDKISSEILNIITVEMPPAKSVGLAKSRATRKAGNK